MRTNTFRITVSVKEILDFLHNENIECRHQGSLLAIEGFSSIIEYQDNTLTWIKSKDKYLSLKSKIDLDRIGLVVVDEETSECANFKEMLICTNPKDVFYSIVERFFVLQRKKNQIGVNTIIAESAIIGNNVYIGNNCYIGNYVEIGDGTQIYHNVVINDNVKVGSNCCIKSGAVIGEEGYGYRLRAGQYYKVSHVGSVIIEDNVDIGANTCIDKGSIGDTVIGKGTKIDNLIHIAHNVHIGNNVLLIAGTIVAGSAKIENDAYLAPGTVVKNQIDIKEKSLIGLGGVVVKDTEKEYVYIGVPAKPVGKRGNKDS